MNDIYTFLIEAKQQTYANASSPKTLNTRINSKDYEYQKGNMTYHDTYFGGTKFIGEEIIYINNETYWGMNYYGSTLDENLSEEAMDNALRPALMMVGKDTSIIPVRGPREYINNNYKYTFEVEGTLEYFNGIEIIYKDNQKIYELRCSGGLIK